ncbi:12863_t:CDS:1, partial [Racocetra fulgida]
QLESKKIFNREEIENHLIEKLGEPNNELQHNLLFELVKKISAYYAPETKQSNTTYSCLGLVSEIVEKRFKEGKRRGQVFYTLKLGEPKGEKFRALQEDLPPAK